MADEQEPRSLEELLDRIEQAGKGADESGDRRSHTDSGEDADEADDGSNENASGKPSGRDEAGEGVDDDASGKTSGRDEAGEGNRQGEDEAGEEPDENSKVSLGEVMDVVGRRSFGPLLLLAGLITLAPIIGDIPGMPTIMGIVVLLTSGQMLFGRHHFWLPGWVLNRSVKRKKLLKGVKWMRRPARFIDRLLRPRLTALTRDGGVSAIGVVSIIIALAMPAMEFVPFSANGAGAALTAFGLSLIARDGLLALIAFVFTAGTLGVVAYNLL